MPGSRYVNPAYSFRGGKAENLQKLQAANHFLLTYKNTLHTAGSRFSIMNISAILELKTQAVMLVY